MMKARVIVVGLIEKEGKFLLGKKSKDVGPYPNTWHIPGGGVNLEEESLENALRREIMEEASIEIEEIRRIGFDEDDEPDKHGEMTHYIFLAFRAKYKSGEVKPGDDMDELSWIDRDELKNLNLNKPSKKLLKSLNLI